MTGKIQTAERPPASHTAAEQRSTGKGLLSLPTPQFLLFFAAVSVVSLLLFFLLVPRVLPVFYSSGEMFGVSSAMVIGMLGMLATSWSSRQPSKMFFGLVMAVMTFRIFVMAGSFAVGFFAYKFEMLSLALGLFATYFLFLFVEVTAFILKTRTPAQIKA